MAETESGLRNDGPTRIWLLRPVTSDDEAGPWDPWYDKAFGFVVRAATEQRARKLAQAAGGDETSAREHWTERSFEPGWNAEVPTWTDPDLVTCVELDADSDDEGVILRDFRSA